MGYDENRSFCIWKGNREHAEQHSKIFIFLDIANYFGGILLPCIGIIVSTSLLITIACKKSNAPTNKTGITCMVAMTVVFLISVVPSYLRIFLPVPANYTIPFLWIQTFSNVFIYYGTNKKFRLYINNSLFRKAE